jgi:hypothetical protein
MSARAATIVGTQLFFDPLGGRRKPYWHRDIQYTGYEEPKQRALLSELRSLHVRIPLRPERSFMSFELMLGEPHPSMPIDPDADQLPTLDELTQLRHPHWYERAHAVLSAM